MLETITLSLETEYEERREKAIKIQKDKSCCPIISILLMHKRKINRNIHEQGKPYDSLTHWLASVRDFLIAHFQDSSLLISKDL